MKKEILIAVLATAVVILSTDRWIAPAQAQSCATSYDVSSAVSGINRSIDDAVGEINGSIDDAVGEINSSTQNQMLMWH